MSLLLNMGDYVGTLAAARCLGKDAVPLIMADSNAKATASFSTYISSRKMAPNPLAGYEIIDWLLTFGKEHPGVVLYPTCDALCWLIAREHDRLSESYMLYYPKEETIITLLDKLRLDAACKACSIPVPTTIFPKSPADLLALSDSKCHYLIKPRTHIGGKTLARGVTCSDMSDLPRAYERYVEKNQYHDFITQLYPGINLPVLQEYHPTAMNGIYSLAGFIGKNQTPFLVLGSNKRMQIPRGLGVGICFEGAPVIEVLKQRVFDLCKKTGYFGIFECEFIFDEKQNDYLLLDFNPRFYGQMAFDIARGLKLPSLAYYASRGDWASFSSCVASAESCGENINFRYSCGWLLKLVLITQTISGRMSLQEMRSWFRWITDSSITYTDASYDKSDKFPYYVDIVRNLAFYLRHPRDFYRKFFLLDVASH